MTGGEKERVQADVTAQYERFPYPAPVDSLSSGILDGSMGVDGCFSRDYHLYWPAARHRDGLDVLVAGCGSKQAVEMAYGVPGARVVAIDLSATSIAHSRRLAEKHGVGNIEFIQMSLFDVADLGRDFDLIVSTGVIHHLHNPAEGLKALRGVLRRDGSMPLMLYGRYGRDSVYLFQDLFRRLGLTVENVTADDIDKMIDLIRNVPDTHPYHLRKDVYCNFKPEEIVDLYLHPHDIPFTVPAILDLLAESGLVLQHWGRQSSYWPRCTSLVGHPFFERVDALDARTQWTICELYNANINRHFFAACRDDRPLSTYKVEFDGDAFWDYVPQVRWHLRYQPRTDGQPGMEAWTVFASAATPQKITLDATQAFVFSLIDGKQSVRDIVQALLPHGDEATARSYVKSVLRDLWMFDAASFCFSADAVAVPALDIDDAFRRAVEFHQAGQETEAERLYWAIMVESPGLPDVNHNLGIIAVEHGRAEAALPLLRSAIELGNDDKPIYFHSLCGALRDLGLFDEARSYARRAVSLFPDDPKILNLAAALETAPWFPSLQGSHAPERQVYMSALVPMLGDGGEPLSVLEVGTFMGASMFTWAQAVERLTGRRAEITCIDPWEDVDAEQYGSGGTGQHLKEGVAHRVFLNTVRLMPERVTVAERRGMSFDVLPTLSGRRFDIIYIDGCHLHPEVLQDIQACDGLLAEGGFICGDDLEAQLHEIDAGIARANARTDFIRDPASGLNYHPGVTLGVGEFFGPVSVFHGFWVMRKGRAGYEPVTMEGGRGVLPYHWPQEYLELARGRIREDGLLAEVL